MNVIFVESAIFEKLRADYLSDDEFMDLQMLLLANPTSGSVIKDTGGLRKIWVNANEEESELFIISLMSKIDSIFLLCTQKMKLQI